MMEAWFSPEFAQNFKWLSLLSFLSLMAIPAAHGLYRCAVVSAWFAAIAVGVVCLGAFVAGRLQGQPDFVLSPLLVAGVVLTAVFCGSLKTLLDAYREVETRRTIAQDL